jgi:hypothetical protein
MLLNSLKIKDTQAPIKNIVNISIMLTTKTLATGFDIFRFEHSLLIIGREIKTIISAIAKGKIIPSANFKKRYAKATKISTQPPFRAKDLYFSIKFSYKSYKIIIFMFDFFMPL